MFCVFNVFFSDDFVLCVQPSDASDEAAATQRTNELVRIERTIAAANHRRSMAEKAIASLVKECQSMRKQVRGVFFLFFFTPQLNPNQLFPFFLTAGRHQHASSSQHFGDGAAGGHPRRHGVFGTSGVGGDGLGAIF